MSDQQDMDVLGRGKRIDPPEMMEYTSYILLINVWASSPLRCLAILTSSRFETMVVTREMRSCAARGLQIKRFQATGGPGSVPVGEPPLWRLLSRPWGSDGDWSR